MTCWLVFSLVCLQACDLHRHADGSERAIEQLQYLTHRLETYQKKEGRYPDSVAFRALPNAPQLDPWGAQYVYEAAPDGSAYLLATLGSDGAPEGVGEARDLEVTRTRGAPAQSRGFEIFERR